MSVFSFNQTNHLVQHTMTKHPRNIVAQYITARARPRVDSVFLPSMLEVDVLFLRPRKGREE